jgi:RecB family exonuclease
MLEPVIYAVPSITLPSQTEPTLINITKGLPLRNTQLFAKVMNWLNNRENGKADDIVSPEFIDKLIDYLFPKKEATDTSDESDAPKGLEWQELLMLESDYQVRKIANQMRKLIADGLGDIPFTLKLTRLLMRRLMENVTMPFHGEPISDIQVLGVLETRMLDFDKLLLLNVEEGVVPQSKADLSFIPYYLRKYYHMQTNDERATVYAYNFFRLLSRAGQTTMLFGNIGGADNSKGMSRFVMQMITSPEEFKINKYRLNEPSIIGNKSLLDENKQSLIEAKGLANIKLSPSALNSYISCPYKFYLEKIRGIQEPEKEEKEMPANVLGSLVHNTMQAIYEDLGCDNANPVEIQAEKLAQYKDDMKLQEMLVKAYQALNQDQLKYHKTKHYVLEEQFMDNPKVIQYVKNLIDNDLRTIETEGLKIWKLEQDFYMKLPVPEIGEIQFGGRIDRVDLCGYKNGHERIRIVDYKTGSYKSDKLSVKLEDIMTNAKKGYVRQTIIYSHVLMSTLDTSKPIQPNLFFCTTDMNGKETVVKVDSEVQDYREIQETIFPKLQAKVKDLLQDSEFPQCAEGECETYCAFYDLCERKKNDNF